MFCSSDLPPSLCVALLPLPSAHKIKIVVFKEHVLFKSCFLCGYVSPFFPLSAQNIKTKAARYDILFKKPLPIITCCVAPSPLKRLKIHIQGFHVLSEIIIRHIYLYLLRFRLTATPKYHRFHCMFCSKKLPPWRYVALLPPRSAQKTKRIVLKCHFLFKIIISCIYICLLHFCLSTTLKYRSFQPMFCSKINLSSFMPTALLSHSISYSKDYGLEVCLVVLFLIAERIFT